MKYDKYELKKIFLIVGTLILLFIVSGIEKGMITHLIFIVIGIIDLIISISSIKKKEFSFGIMQLIIALYIFRIILKDILG